VFIPKGWSWLKIWSTISHGYVSQGCSFSLYIPSAQQKIMYVW
jgi:hypothetical protein